MIYYLYAAAGDYEDYHEAPLFYGTKEFIEQKHEEYAKGLRYLEKRMTNFYSKYSISFPEDIMYRYLRALGYHYCIYGRVTVSIDSIKSFEEFQNERH